MNKARQKKRVSRIYGVVVGIVSDNVDPEGLARVKVSFPWLDRKDSHWARIATLMAGKERGSFFLPEVGDEVLIAFERGNLNYPYVIGALWNGKDTPPYINEGENNIRAFKSRSGHQIVFNDTDGSERITIIDKSGNNALTIDTVSNTITIEGENIELRAQSGKISLDAQQLQFRSSTNTEIQAGANMDVKSVGNMTIKGAMVMIN